MSAALFVFGFFALIISLVIFIIKKIRKKETKKVKRVMIVSAVAAIVGFIAFEPSESQPTTADVDVQEEQKKEQNKDDKKKEPEIKKEQLFINLTEAKHEGTKVIVKGTTNIADGVRVGVGLEGNATYDLPIIPGFAPIENGEFVATLGGDEPILNGTYPITVSIGSHDNEKLNEVYGSHDDFKNKYSIKGELEKTDIGFNVNGIKIGEIEITEGVTEEQLAKQRLEAKKQEAVALDFKQLNKNPDRHAGEYVKYTGEILQIQEGSGVTVIRLGVTKTSYGYSASDVIWVEYVGYTDFVDDDVVTVYGTVIGSHSYTSTIGATITLPAIMADIIE